MPYIYDEKILTEHYNTFQPRDTLWYRNPQTEFDEYDATERIVSGYIMAEINIGGLMILPGVRYEQDYNEYQGTVGFRRGTERAFSLTDTVGDRTIGTWLPMLHLRYKFMDNLSLRLAATKTLTRPDFLNLSPFEYINYGSQHRTINRGSLDLAIPTAWNYDAIVNFNSRFGFFSVGAFYKKIENVDIDIKYKDLSGTAATNPTFGYQITNPINSEDPTTVFGMEFDIQTNFRWLPKPFDGLVLNLNYAFVNSETYYPFFFVEYPPPEYLPVIADSSRINRLPGQADDIINLTLGYEKKGFSARFSMNFQGNKLTSSGASGYLDTYSADYLRWDAVVSQKFAKRWMVILNLINFTNTPEKSYMYIPENPTQEEYYGWAANLAIRFEL
jgi:TonB-dependent receptor